MSISGSHVVAGTGDLIISGQNVTIDSQFDTNGYQARQWTRESGLTISLGLSGAAGQAVSQAVALGEQARQAKEARSDRAAALYGIAATRSAYDLGNAVGGILNPAAGAPTQGGGGGNNLVGVSVSASYGSSKTENKYESHDTMVAGSTITSHQGHGLQ